jgi:hypothetical protein
MQRPRKKWLTLVARLPRDCEWRPCCTDQCPSCGGDLIMSVCVPSFEAVGGWWHDYSGDTVCSACGVLCCELLYDADGVDNLIQNHGLEPVGRVRMAA